MAYIDYEYFESINPESGITESEFSILLRKAEREIDKATSGVDNVRKLKVAFPTDVYDAETVKECVCDIVKMLHEIDKIEKMADSFRGAVERPDGTFVGKVVTNVSAGNESIGFSTNGFSFETTLSNAAKGIKEKEITIKEFIYGCLSGVTDANGVNLLYDGKYPYWIKK